MDIIFDKIKDSYKSNLPFVAYRKPQKDIVSGVFMKNDNLIYATNFSEAGFVFSPFKNEEKTILFPIEFSDVLHGKFQLEDECLVREVEVFEDTNDKENHLKLVEKALNEIHSNSIKKVVVSREKKVEIDNFNLLKTFINLLKSYANAFVYVWYHPKVGLWFGATPETLLFTKGNTFKTMSLAGTQLYNSNESIQRTIWKSKELEEQQLVTDFIENQLKDIGKELHVDKTETVRAGNLLHLKTKVTGVLKENSNLETLIRALHPTPAVCGLPRDLANDFIVNNENYKRTFYTGFLGELNLNSSNSETKNSQLFVNLRCMRIENQKATIYVGGGITKDSNAAKEWEETVSKALTMKQVL